MTSQEFSDAAIEDGSRYVEYFEYAVELESRSGTVNTEKVENIRWNPELSAVKNAEVTIPEVDYLETNYYDYLGGDLRLYTDGDLTYEGIIESIDFEQNSESISDYTISTRHRAQDLESDIMDKTFRDQVIPDAMAKVIDGSQYNGFDNQHDDLVNTADESLTDIETVTETVRRGTTDGATAAYSNVGSSAGDLERVYVKGFGELQFDIISNDGTWTFTFADSTETHERYGEWRSIDVSEVTGDSYDIEFIFRTDNYLYDWSALTDVTLSRSVEPFSTDKLQENKEFYSYTGSEVVEAYQTWLDNQDTTYEANDGTALSEEDVSMVVPDHANNRIRSRNVVDWFVYGQDSQFNCSADDDASAGITWGGTGGSRHNILGPTQHYGFEDDLWDWGMYARVKTVTNHRSDGREPLNYFDFEVNGNTQQVGITMPPEGWGYEWVRFPRGSWYNDWPDHVMEDETLKVQYQLASSGNEASINIDCHVVVPHFNELADRAGIDYTNFDNTLDSNGHLAHPRPYAKAANAKMTSETSVENIDASTVDAAFDTSNPQRPGGDWGVRQKIAEEAEFSGPWSNSDTDTESSYKYPGVSHRTQLRLASHGYRTNQTPTEGYNPHIVDGLTVTGDTNDLEVLSQVDADDNRLAVLSNLANGSTTVFRWTIDECDIFNTGDYTVDVDEIRMTDADSSVSIEGTYSTCEVRGKDGVTSGIVEAVDSPDFVDRHKRIVDLDIETEEDAYRRARTFLREHSEVQYEGAIDTLPTFAPLGEIVPGENFTHGQDMVIESVRYGKRNTTMNLGWERNFGQEFISLQKGQRTTFQLF